MCYVGSLVFMYNYVSTGSYVIYLTVIVFGVLFKSNVLWIIIYFFAFMKDFLCS